MPFPRFSVAVGCMALIAFMAMAVDAHAFRVVRDNTDSQNGTKVFVVPYVFSSEATGFGWGVGGAMSGWPQKQAAVGGTVWRTSDKTDAIYLNLTDLQLPFAKRVFFTIHGMEASYDNMVSYPSGTGTDGGRAGGNDSGRNSYYQGHGWDQWAEAEFTYVMPWGPYGDKPIHTYVTERGLLADGSVYNGEYNPFRSGRSYFKVKPFYRKRWFQEKTPDNSDVETAGIRFTWEYDNTDFVKDPSEGSATIARLYQGLNTGRTDTWTALEFDFSKYWSLGESDLFQKRVVAFNFWTVDTPSWEYREDGTVSGASPYYMGAALGGYAKQRGFPFYRFHDKAAINYALEYRIIPRWNPLESISWFKWWEVAPFVEVGRVAQYWNPIKMLGDTKISGGVGLRCMVHNAVFRLDLATSAEGSNIWAMVNQPF